MILPGIFLDGRGGGRCPRVAVSEKDEREERRTLKKERYYADN
jgi:hypothetical protein